MRLILISGIAVLLASCQMNLSHQEQNAPSSSGSTGVTQPSSSDTTTGSIYDIPPTSSEAQIRAAGHVWTFTCNEENTIVIPARVNGKQVWEANTYLGPFDWQAEKRGNTIYFIEQYIPLSSQWFSGHSVPISEAFVGEAYISAFDCNTKRVSRFSNVNLFTLVNFPIGHITTLPTESTGAVEAAIVKEEIHYYDPKQYRSAIIFPDHGEVLKPETFIGYTEALANIQRQLTPEELSLNLIITPAGAYTGKMWTASGWSLEPWDNDYWLTYKSTPPYGHYEHYQTFETYSGMTIGFYGMNLAIFDAWSTTKPREMLTTKANTRTWYAIWDGQQLYCNGYLWLQKPGTQVAYSVSRPSSDASGKYSITRYTWMCSADDMKNNRSVSDLDKVEKTEFTIDLSKGERRLIEVKQ